MIYTGYIDSEREPIKVGDYMASEEEYTIGVVLYDKRGLVLSYGDTFDELKTVANDYHIVSEKHAEHLYELQIERLKTDF